jgi:uncharacterized repeat protein (TIGR01451 family)
MKPTTPRPFFSNSRVLTSLFVSFVILVAPIMPVVSAQARLAGYLSNSLIKEIKPVDAGSAKTAEPLGPPSAIISATKVDSFADPNNDGKAEEGDTITYDVNISNTGVNDATDVAFNDTIDPNTTLVPGSLKVSPLAFADTYNATKNIALSIPAPGVLANDTGMPGPSAVPIAGGATANGGTISLAADGSFTYTPPSGFTGADTFNYTVTNGLTPDDSATVTINVDEGPSVTTTSPTNGATNVQGNTNITVNFSEPVNATTSSFSIECPGGSPQAYTLSASPSASFTLDPVADLPAGQTCTVTVIANQITDADNFDPPDQMAANYVFSFGVKVEAVDDMHSVTGNVRINTASSGFSVLANDSPGVTITAFDATSVKGGEVTMNTSTGTFTYNPPRGFTGTDSFNYTVSSGAGSDTATVVLNVTDMIWFINSAPGACSSGCDGRLTHPFTSLSDFEAINGNGATSGGAVVDPEAGDNIFIYTGSGNYTGPLTLESSQKVIGQGASSSIETLAGIALAPDSDALPATGGTNPVITNPSGGGIILAQDNNLHGLTVSNTSGTALSGNTFGTLTVSENVVLSNTATAGTAVSLSNGALAASFRSISAGNAAASPAPANAIVLTNTTGSFAVTGSGGACTSATPTCTGGTIQNIIGADDSGASPTGTAVVLNNAQGVSLTRMHIKGNTNYGIRGTNVTGFTLDTSLVDGQNGSNSNSPFRDSSIRFNGLFGSSSFTNSDISGGFLRNIEITNTSGSLNLTVDNCSIHDTGAAPFSGGSSGDDGLFVENQLTANITAHITNNTFARHGGDHFNGSLSGTGTVSYVITGNKYSGGHPVGLGQGFFILAASFNGTFTYNISNNGSLATPLTGNNQGGAIVVNKGSGNASFSGRIENNVIGNPAIAGSGSQQASGIVVEAHGKGSHTVLINNNLVRQFSGDGIDLIGGQVTAGSLPGDLTFDATVTNNTVSNPNGANSLQGVLVNMGTNAGDNFAACMDVRTNSLAGAGADGDNGTLNNGGFDLRMRQRQSTTVRLPGFVGGPNADAFESGQNTLTTVATSAVTTFGGGPACATPVLVTLNTQTARPDYLAQADVDAQNKSAESVFARFVGGDFTSAIESINRINLSDASAVALANTQTERIAKADTGLDNSINRPANQSAARLAHNQKARAARAASSARARNMSVPFAPSGETVNATIGTLPAGKSVRVQFQVTVNSPLPSGVSQVSNQGTISGSNFASVQTDDPAAGGSADPTVTPILTPPDIKINDASVAEPSSGSSPAAFTVTLSHAFSQTVTVSFATANDTGGANPATAGSDYTATAGTVTFNPGETVQTISVPVLADADNSETAETFLVNISGATNGVITDAQAVGTINPNGTPGTVVISELRTSGPGGPDDDFVELANNTDSAITVQASDASAGWALVKSGSTCSDTPVIIAVIPNGTVIPARGNYLLTGSAYSLSGYATADLALSANIEDDRNVALFTTADLSNIQTGTRLDGVGFGGNTGNNCDLLREGANLQAASGSTSEYSFVRKVVKGETIDAGDNASDFRVVSTTPATAVGSNLTPALGAPGPENSSGPRGPVPCSSTGTAKFDRARLDSSQAVGAAPNTVRDTTSDPVNNSTYGTLDLRRRFTNNTGGSVTQLRFRIVDMTTTPSPSGTADLRARTSSATLVTGVNDAATCNGSAPCNVTVTGTLLETPPVQALGGGVNSSLGAGTITLATPLNNGASVNLRFLFGVEQEGNYHIGIVIETTTTGQIGQDIWELKGNTQTGGHTDGGCNTPPVANAGADQTVECAGGATPVTLDGSASSDPDGDTPLSYEWREGVTVLGTGATLSTSLAFGSHTITLKVTDPSGDYSEDTVTVNVVDTSDPLITAPPNISVSTGPGATTCGVVLTDAQLGTASASDGCSASVTVTRTGVPAGNNFPVGQTIITYTADDGHGHTKSAMQTVTVTDDTVPILSVPPDQTVNAPANSCSANVNPGTASASDNCSGVNVVGTRSDNQPLNAPYPVGVTTITWKATDASGNITTGTQTITVKDATAPVIVLTTGTITLSPPNHQYQTFSIADLVSSVSDQCDGGVDISDVVISQVTSDEIENGNGDGNTPNDIVIAPDCKSLQVRRERQGGGDGRVYTITLKVKDSSGNVATAVRKIYVPNSGPVIDSGAHYTVNGCTP